ncbi:hypothetical protein FACS1894184_05890 [Clostridia bacterium]|nr:hypothetical protein FACS1894184_05890 [Clostridia bacterium]
MHSVSQLCLSIPPNTNNEESLLVSWAEKVFAVENRADAFQPIWPVPGVYYITCLYKYKDGRNHSTRYDRATGKPAIDIAEEEEHLLLLQKLEKQLFQKRELVQHLLEKYYNQAYRWLYLTICTP